MEEDKLAAIPMKCPLIGYLLRNSSGQEFQCVSFQVVMKQYFEYVSRDPVSYIV